MSRRRLAFAFAFVISLLAVACTSDRAPQAAPAPLVATVTPAKVPTPFIGDDGIGPTPVVISAPPFPAGVTNMPDALDPSVLGMSPLELLEASDEATRALRWVLVVERVREGPGFGGEFSSYETRYQWGGPGALERVFVSLDGEPSDDYRRGPSEQRWFAGRTAQLLAGRSLTDFSVPASDVRLIAEEVVGGRPAWVIWYGYQRWGLDSLLRLGRTEWIAKDDLVLLSQVEDLVDSGGSPGHFTRVLSDFNDPPDIVEHNYNPLFYELAADIPLHRRRGVDGAASTLGSPRAVRSRLPFAVALPVDLPTSWRLYEGELLVPEPGQRDESKLTHVLALEFRSAELAQSFVLRQGAELDWRAAGAVAVTLARDVQALASDVTACSDGGSCATVRVGWFSCDRGFELTMPPGADPLGAIDLASAVVDGCAS